MQTQLHISVTQTGKYLIAIIATTQNYSKKTFNSWPWTNRRKPYKIGNEV